MSPILICACVCVRTLSHVLLFAAPWTVAWQAPLSMEFPKQEYWSGLPFPPPGNLPDSGIKPASPALAGRSLPLNHQGSPILIYITSKYDSRIPSYRRQMQQPSIDQCSLIFLTGQKSVIPKTVTWILHIDVGSVNKFSTGKTGLGLKKKSNFGIALGREIRYVRE